MDMNYFGVYCHKCGNRVCLTCGCCCNYSCEMFSCPERKRELTEEKTRDEYEHGSFEICEMDEEIDELKSVIMRQHLLMESAEQRGISKASEEIAALKKQLEDRECCENCKHLVEDYKCLFHQSFIATPDHVCNNWTSDGKTREERGNDRRRN